MLHTCSEKVIITNPCKIAKAQLKEVFNPCLKQGGEKTNIQTKTCQSTKAKAKSLRSRKRNGHWCTGDKPKVSEVSLFPWCNACNKQQAWGTDINLEPRQNFSQLQSIKMCSHLVCVIYKCQMQAGPQIFTIFSWRFSHLQQCPIAGQHYHCSHSVLGPSVAATPSAVAMRQDFWVSRVNYIQPGTSLGYLRLFKRQRARLAAL